jgi:hypothetical protein
LHAVYPLCGIEENALVSFCDLFMDLTVDTKLLLRNLLLVCALLFVAVSPACAQDNYEIQVYSYDLVEPHHTMVELHSNFTIDGSKTVVNGLYPTNHAEHETIEITHGFTAWLEVGFYIFTSERSGQGIQWVGDHIRPRIAVPKKWKWPVGLSLSNEVGYQRRQFSTDTWTWEMRPIVDKQLGRWYLSLNPTFDKCLHGQGVGQGFVFSPNFKFSYDFTKKIAGGLEYYGSVGPATDFLSTGLQQHQNFSSHRFKFIAEVGSQLRLGRRRHPLDRSPDR